MFPLNLYDTNGYTNGRNKKYSGGILNRSW